MFLTKKGLFKILIIAICYFIVGSSCITAALIFLNLGIKDDFLFRLGAIACAFGILSIFWGRYAEGKGKLVNLGNRLVRNELKPAEFIKEYEILKNSKDLVINKPGFEILQLVAIAYDYLDDREHCLATVEEMIAVASEKKKTYAKLIKTSFLFSYGKTEEAEKLFTEIQKLKLNFMCLGLMDAILKSDRAMAMGDYKIAEAYNLQMLEQAFPKLDNLGKLTAHYQLGEVYQKLQDNEKALSHYRYCVDYGGETALRESAKAATESLK